LVGLFVAALGIAPAAAQTTPEECAAIAADAERLACYDAIFRSGTLPQPEGAVVIESERLIPARPTGREPATMTIACMSGDVTVSFAFAGHLVSNTGDIAPVTFQIDQNATAVRTLSADEANTSLRFGPGRESETFLDGLTGGTNLKVRMTPVRQRSLTVDFRLPPHEAPIGALRASCG
jgi:type VI secretion system protein VasI